MIITSFGAHGDSGNDTQMAEPCEVGVSDDLCCIKTCEPYAFKVPSLIKILKVIFNI